MAFMALIFGEDSTDTTAIAILVEAINDRRPQPVDDLRVKSLRDPPILRREASPVKLKTQAQKIAAFVRGHSRNNRMVLAIAHRDCDDVEPSHERCARELLDDLKAAGVTHAVVAAPAWEIEAWWMLFPEAVSQVRSCWRRIDYGHANVGHLRNAKERLTRDLRASGSKFRKCRDYTESDGIKIAENVRRLGLKNLHAVSQSCSFSNFVDKLDEALSQ